jgi:3-hydroxyisobutyrate dehydrogenase-like beta-hydroxyacid dehydrogenase
MTSHIGFIGLGTMGSRMAANVRAHGYELTVFNRTRDRAAALLRAGARWAESPAAVAPEAEVLFTMLPDPAAVSASALGDGGFLGAMRNDTIWVNCGTVNPSFARDMAAAARSNRVRYVDAPVAGSKAAAQQAELLFMVGADSADLEACRPESGQPEANPNIERLVLTLATGAGKTTVMAMLMLTQAVCGR